MKVMLVATNRERFPYAVAPLGAAFITNMLRFSGHEAYLLDLAFVKKIEHSIRKAVHKFNPDIIGLSVRNLDNCSYHHPHSYYEYTRKVVDAIRRISDVEIIAGGSAISVGKTELLRYLGIQYGITGEGEKSVLRLLDALKDGSIVSDIPGVIDAGAESDKSIIDPLFDCDLSEIPMNADAGIAYKRYFKNGGFVSIQTKRGCSFKCVYCNYPALEGRRYRLRPPEQCVNDIERFVKDSGLRDFFFVDSVFNFPSDHAKEICREIVRRDLRIRWMAYCNPSGLDKEMADLFKRSGCAGVELGLDAVTDKMLKNMGKSFAQQDIIRTFDALHETGIPYAVFLLFGGPEQNWEDIENARIFLDEHFSGNAVFASLGIRIYEDTPIYDISMREGVITSKTDLLKPTYYVSKELGNNPIDKLDDLVCQTHTWITPNDWDSFLIRTIQKISGRFRAIPAWKGVSGYGKHMRRRRRA